MWRASAPTFFNTLQSYCAVSGKAPHNRYAIVAAATRWWGANLTVKEGFCRRFPFVFGIRAIVSQHRGMTDLKPYEQGLIAKDQQNRLRRVQESISLASLEFMRQTGLVLSNLEISGESPLCAIAGAKGGHLLSGKPLRSNTSELAGRSEHRE